MTTIAWDGKTLAADRMCTDGNQKFSVTKITKHGDELIGYSGGLSRCKEILEWYTGERKPTDFPKGADDDYSELFVVRDGKVFLYGDKNPIEPEESKFAVGSGAAYALAAMHCGLDAEGAIEVASKFDPGTGLGVDALTWEAK